MKAVLLIVLFISLLSFANEFTQTDWSGGGGVEGPVPSWGNTFFEANNIFFENTTLILGIGAFLENPISQIIADSLPNSNSLVCGDIDNDGDIDVIGTGQKEGQVVWYENVGGTGNSWNTNVIAVHDSSDYYVIELVVTDMDCDGDLDVIGGIGDGASSSELSWWENLDGSGTAWAEHEDFVDYYCSPIYTGDIDNDGDVDLLANYYSPEDDTGVWLENENGLGTQWTVHNIVEDIECFKYAYVADIDGDGDMDVLSSYRNPYPLSHFVSWWENVDGSGISWIEHVVYESDEDAFSVYAADLDDDGDIDRSIRYFLTSF